MFRPKAPGQSHDGMNQMARRSVLNNHSPHGYLCVALLFALFSDGCSPRGGVGNMEHEGSAVLQGGAPEASAPPTAVRSAGANTGRSAGSGTPSQAAPSTAEASGNELPAAAPEKPRIAAECISPLKELCTAGYRAHACDVIRKSVEDPSIFTKERFVHAEFGTCGDFRYTYFGDGFESYLSYYDERGELKGVRVSYDVISPPCMGQEYLGEPIECSREPGKWYRSKQR
jgi:hypothetical protein